MKPNYEKMSVKELRAYVLGNREDVEAIDFMMNRVKTHSIMFPPATTEEEIEAQMETFKNLLENKKEGNV